MCRKISSSESLPDAENVEYEVSNIVAPQESEDNLLEGSPELHSVTWLDDDQIDELDLNLDQTNLFFHRVDSADIIYRSKKKMQNDRKICHGRHSRGRFLWESERNVRLGIAVSTRREDTEEAEAAENTQRRAECTERDPAAPNT